LGKAKGGGEIASIKKKFPNETTKPIEKKGLISFHEKKQVRKTLTLNQKKCPNKKKKEGARQARGGREIGKKSCEKKKNGPGEAARKFRGSKIGKQD